jgi:hypothetical protein
MAWWRHRKLAGTVLVGTLVAGMGAVASAGPTTAAQAASAQLGYTCAFPSGPQQVSVQIAATFPAAGVVSQPIQPVGVTMTASIPPAALADLSKLTAATVSGRAQLVTAVTQNGQTVNATWPGLTVPSTPVPSTDGLVLAASGPVPPVTASAPGEVTFTAGSVSLVITPLLAGGGATSPATMELVCTLNAGQDALLATVPTTGPATPTASGSVPAGHGAIKVGAPANAPVQPAESTPIDTNVYSICKNIQTAPGKLVGPYPASADVAGYANASKLNGSALLGEPTSALAESQGPDEGLFQEFRVPIGTENYICVLTTLQLDYNGQREFPPATVTALAFGFMPVTATLTFAQAGPRLLSGCTTSDSCPPVTEVAYQQLPANVNPYTVVSTAQVSLSVSNVKVNGVPLSVSQDCRTDGPVYSPDSPADPGNDLLVLTGGSAVTDPAPPFGSILNGGSLAGTPTVPYFTGCTGPGGENLDPLFDATLSGPDNYTKLTQGILCYVNTGNGAPVACLPGGFGHPQPPVPQR